MDNGSSAVIDTGGSALSDGTQPNRVGVFGQNSSTVTVAGGTVRGGDTNNGGGVGVEVRGGSFDFTGGSVTGGDGDVNGGFGALLSSDAVFTMSDGQLTGGNGATGVGGEGLGVSELQSVQFLGGTISKGQGAAGTDQFSVRADSTAQLTIKGGIFDGDFIFRGNSSLIIFGSDLAFDQSSRALTGILQDGNAIDLLLFKAPDAFLTLNEVAPAAPTDGRSAFAGAGILLLSGIFALGLLRLRRRAAYAI